MLISFIAYRLRYDLSEEKPRHRKPFKENQLFNAQSLIRIKIIEPNGQRRYKFIKEEEKALDVQTPSLKQEYEQHLFPLA